MRRALLVLLAPRSAPARERRRRAPPGAARLARRGRRRPADRPAFAAAPSGTAWPAAAWSRCAPRSTGARSSPPGPPTPTSRARTRVVLAAAQRGLGVLPVLHGTPGWAALNPGDPASPPRDPADFARLLTALVTRYGPNGSFWAEHPEVAKAADPRVADLERAEPDALLERRPVGAVLRRAAQGRGPRAQGRRPGLARRSWPACRTRAGRRFEAIYDEGARGAFDVVDAAPIHRQAGERRSGS